MGIDQKFLNKSLFVTLCLCIMLLSWNITGLFGSSVKYSFETFSCSDNQLSLWQKVDENRYTLSNFNSNAYLSLKQYLKRTNDKKLVSFEVDNGRATIVFEAV